MNKVETKFSFDRILKSLNENKFVLFALLVMITISFSINYAKCFDTKLDQGGDNIYYYSLGKSLHDGNGYVSEIGFEAKPHTHFPPGYPLFISFIMNFFPDSIIAVKLANGVLLYLSIILLFFIISKLTRNRLISFIVCLLCCLQKDLLHFASIMMSEPLYIMLSVLLLYLFIKLVNIDKRKRKLWQDVVLIIAITLITSYIYLVRTMGLSIIIAYAIALSVVIVQTFIKWRKSNKEADAIEANSLKKNLLIFAVALILSSSSLFITMKAWQSRNQELGVTSSTYASNFQKKENGEVMSTKKDWTDRIISNTENYLTKWVPETIFTTEYDMEEDITAKQWIVGILMAIVMIFGIIALRHCNLLILFYLGITMSVLLLYPEQYGGNRYYVPLIPFFIFVFINGTAKIAGMIISFLKIENSRIAAESIVFVAFSLLFMFPSYLKSQSNNQLLATYKSWDDIAAVKPFNDYVDAAQWCGKNLPDTTRMICRKPEIFYAYSNRHKAESFPWYADADSILDYLIEKKATHVIVDGWYKHAYQTLAPAINKFGDKFFLVETVSEIDTVNEVDGTFIFEFHPERGYHGDYLDGKMNGHGRYIWADSSYYEGEFANDRINGYGKYYGLNGTFSEGYWIEDQKDGEGMERYADSTVYRGRFKNNLPNGYGKYYDKDGNILVDGHWRNGLKDGQGTEYFKDGRFYKGSFKNNMPNGYGEYYDKNGRLLAKGIWLNGKLELSIGQEPLSIFNGSSLIINNGFCFRRPNGGFWLVSLYPLREAKIICESDIEKIPFC